uniref:Tyrosine-protein kinase BAZ1B n=1 Tax=Xenopus laevis TaxID=8355 RepID=BAZ1B_XENLA|nr:RecName: Full=Tyrosine-protein kinase BAZ1B; AltName: Full=Bromodomain adjacent to zinc finger domain protein 1B; AltName: Full=Williams syndrome transcription factor homolog [Xenopus laevis]
MAPLLGRRPFPLVKPLSEAATGEGEEEVYMIEHSKEAFRSREEYESRLERYAERIWTCKSTGSSQLTHKEAWDEEQEVAELLKEEFPVWYEKQVLEMVHHNTISLDKLVDQSWMEIMTKYADGEECDFEVGPEKYLRAKIVKVHPLEKEEQASEKKSEGSCDSPSSDKENSNKVAQDIQLKEESNRLESLSSLRESDRARRSPRKLPTSLKKEEKKWVPPKFLPHKYDVKLLNEDKVISFVPVDSLYRSERPPNKEILRYFIRHNALRIGTGENAPWVVEDELVKKYTLPSKFSDFLLDPHKYMTLNPSSATKRKSLGSPDQKPAKKSKKSPLSPSSWSLANLKKTAVNSSSSEEEMQLMIGANLNKKGSIGKKSDKKKPKNGKSQVLNGQKISAKTRSPKKGLKSPKLKQMTLLDMAKSTPKVSRAQKGGSNTPRSSSKPNKYLPPAALHLISYYRDNKNREDRKSALSALISKVARMLSAEDRKRLPDDLQELVQKRYELLEHRKQWAVMTEEQREEYMRKKREALKARIKEKTRERKQKEREERLEKQKRYEDQDLTGKSLPTFKLVDTPEGLPNALFGDVAMVIEFLSGYSDLLLPDGQYPVTAVSLMEALAAEKGGFMYLNRGLVVLLQTLLQDEIAEDYGELGMKLSEIPLTLHSASELVRLCLRKSDSPAGENESIEKGDEDSEGSAVYQDDEVEDEYLEKLETSEFFELTTEEKLHILAALCHRILMTYSVQDHVDAKQQRSGELWKERLAILKGENDKKRAAKQKRKEQGTVKPKEEVQAAKIVKKQEKINTQQDNDAEDMISAVKSRRLQAMQAKKEKEEHEKLTKERIERETEEERSRKQKASAEKAFHEGIAKAKLVLRRSPLGTDRNHNRYWLFSDEVPGLYIEKGWVHDSINYRFSPESKQDSEQDAEESEDANSSIGCPDDSTQREEKHAETTVPKQGQNLWFLCDTQKELDELLDSLHPQGFRESQLKERLQNRYQDIMHSIHLARKQNLGLKTCDGQQELLNFLRSDIIEVATRLQKGGLGYLDDTTEFEAKVRTFENLKDFGECIVFLQAAVIKKFLQGFMAPKQKKRKHQSEEAAAKAEEQDEEKKMAEEAKVASAVEKWKVAIRDAQTFSRMHVLLGMLDACIKWDMSSENARCKVCRKKGEDDKLILCDECNKAFHLFCLRPVLFNIPDGEWLCPACQPATARRSSRGRNYAEDSTQDEDEEEEEEESEEEEEEESDEEEEEQEMMGQRLRSRKAAKGKPGRPTRRGRPPKNNTHSRVSRQRYVEDTEADVEEMVRQSKPTSRRQNQEFQKCEEILAKLIKYRFSWPFREPFNADEIEDYTKVVTTPMDFQTMQSKCSCGSYQTVQEFLNDLKLVFGNTELYYEAGSSQLSCLEKTEQCARDLLGKHLPAHTYQRRHRKHQSPEPEPETANPGRGRKQKK